jgi:hypothetical protein
MDTPRVLDLLEAGDWKAAQEIVQKESSTLAAWLHGIVHTLEGDLDNARYWYEKVGREFPGPTPSGRRSPPRARARPPTRPPGTRRAELRDQKHA